MIIPVRDAFEADELPIRRYPENRRRTVNLFFSVDQDRLSLRAWGDAFPDDGGGGFHGRLQYSAPEIRAAIAALRQVWQHHVIERYEDREDSLLREFPFADNWDLSTTAHPTRWQEVGLRLAREGRQLYRLLFEAGDEGLREIGRQLTAALIADEQIIAIHSEDLHVPWSMLYTPQPSALSLETPGATWAPSGFWGYRHLLEQCVDRVRRHDSRIRSDTERLAIGMNVDRRLDAQFKEHPCVAPMIEFFRDHTDVEIRETRYQLAGSFEDGCRTEQIVYYACHMNVSGRDGASLSQAQLRLGDDEPIRTSDFQSWLANKHFTPGPVVFANGCQGGQLASQFYSSFGAVLLRAGVNCLIGPQVDVPPLFAYEYAHRFFKEFFQHGARIGDIVRSLARDLADGCENPLGIAISLYRGLDTHLAPFEALTGIPE